jgi:hypothetical protein
MDCQHSVKFSSQYQLVEQINKCLTTALCRRWRHRIQCLFIQLPLFAFSAAFFNRVGVFEINYGFWAWFLEKLRQIQLGRNVYTCSSVKRNNELCVRRIFEVFLTQINTVFHALLGQKTCQSVVNKLKTSKCVQSKKKCSHSRNKRK